MAARILDIESLHQQLKTHPRSAEMGMIASHRGLVRGTSRTGALVSGLTIHFNQKVVESIVESTRQRPGIIEVVARYNEGSLKVGDDVLVVLVAGDIRENVFPALVDAVEQIKRQGASKTEDII
jgi:molybdopterin synthase catalytic subunit